MSVSHWRCARSSAGFIVVGYDVDDHRVKRLNDGESYVEDISDEQLACGDRDGPVHRIVRDPFVRGVRHRGRDRSDAATRRCSRSVVHRRRGRCAVAIRASRLDGHPRVDHLSGHDAGDGGATTRRRFGSRRRHRLLRGLQPRAHRSGQPHMDVGEHARRSSRASTTRRSPRSRVSTIASSIARSRSRRRKKPSSPSCSRTRSVM